MHSFSLSYLYTSPYFLELVYLIATMWSDQFAIDICKDHVKGRLHLIKVKFVFFKKGFEERFIMLTPILFINFLLAL